MGKYDYYTTFDRPIPYKTLLFYPVRMQDYHIFMHTFRMFIIDKNSIPDMKIISMNYWEYLYHLYKQGGKEINLFVDMLIICLRINDVEQMKFYPTKKGFFLNGVVYTSQDFDNIRELISEQNNLELIDENISKDVRDSIEKAHEYRAKQSGNKTAGLEEQMVCLSVGMGMPLEEIYKMPIRKFNKMIQRLDKKIHYEIYLSASMSGMVTFKDKKVLQHWMADMKKDKFGDAAIDLETVANSISEENAIAEMKNRK